MIPFLSLGLLAQATGETAAPPAAGSQSVQVAAHSSRWDYPKETAPAPGQEIHFVEKGDTLWDLGTKYLGNPFAWPQIWELNKWVKDPHWIYPGDPILVESSRSTVTHALTSLEQAQRREELILDSAALLPFLVPLAAHSRVVDFGTGMGIPAVLIALARPDLEVIALDKSNKKIAFVRQAALELKLANLVPLVGRAEAIAPLRAQAGVAKAVGTLDLLGGWWRRHGVPGAPFWALKGPEGPWEAPAGFRVRTHPYLLPTRGRRTVVELAFNG